MRIDVVTLFPDLVQQVVNWGVTGRAAQQGLLTLANWNPRDFADDRHRTVDDRPYGGGPGMVMKVEQLRRALAAARAAAAQRPVCVYLTPQGQRLTQRTVKRLAETPRLLLLCGRYEGIDERLVASEVDEELSIGDYVLSGGELPAMVLVDAIARLLPGALGHTRSAEEDSFSDGLLDCPHYTRPERLDGVAVPAVLLGGDHAAIGRWRRQQALGRSWLRRPELIDRDQLSTEDRRLLDEFIEHHRTGRRDSAEPGRG